MSGSSGAVPDELHVLAGEYVLGVLDMAEMRAVRRRAMADPAFAAAIVEWEQRLAPIADIMPPLPPPDALWARIEEAVAPLPLSSGDEVGVLSASREAALLPPTGGRPRAVTGRRARPWGWQLATFASLALAAGIAAIALLPTFGPRLGVPADVARRVATALSGGPTAEPAARFATLLPPDTHAAGFLARARPDGTVVLSALAGVVVPSGHDLELWILPPGGKAPAPLGVLPASGRTVTLPGMPPEGTQLMVSLEPPGGSPTGAPTGPVLYAGSLAPSSP
jgi:anti-sigma-K factor RskA